MSSKLKIASAQINNGFSGQYYLPYSTALLQAYTLANCEDPDQYEFLLPLYKRIHVDEAVAHMSQADIAVFSCYVWNEQISLEIAKRISEVNKNIFIVFGGPQVPDSAEAFLRKNSFIDVVCHQEGERTFLKILEACQDRNFDEINGISFLKGGEFINTPNLKRLRDFSEVPSPFLSGAFDALLKANPDEHWLASWETNRGCPFSCAYCDWGSATNSRIAKMEMDRIKAELDWFSQNKIEFVFCCDANFGILPRDIEIAEYAAANKKKYGYPHVLSVQNTKNARERAYKAQKILVDAGLSKGVTLAMQSVDPNTLKQIKRDNISLDVYRDLQNRFAKDNIPTYTEFILSLPGDTYESFSQGVSDVIASGQHNRIQYNILSILPNSEMAQLEYRELHGLKTVPTPIVNNHGSIDLYEDGIYESQELVIATDSLPAEDWRKVKVYASTSEILHFNKLLQIPLILIHLKQGVSFKDLFEGFISADSEEYPLLFEMIQFFDGHAAAIQNGGAEFIHSKEWLDIHWPPGEFFYIKMSNENRLEQFYKEAENLLCKFVESEILKETVKDAVSLNKNLLKQPFREDDTEITAEWPVAEFYTAALEGANPEISKEQSIYRIKSSQESYDDWLDWMRNVVWYGHRRGAYLYGLSGMKKDLAGHY